MPTMDQPLATAMLVDRQRVFINQNDHTWLVLHKTAGFHTAQEVAQFFATDPNMASVHYVVGRDGIIVQCVSEADGAGGNCCLETGHAPYLPLGVNLNVKTVSIEHVDPATDNSTPLTDAQKAASFRLVRDICLRHNIPMRRGDKDGGIIGHCDIAPLSRARCPGNYPMDELFSFLQNGGQQEDVPVIMDMNNPVIAAFFTETNGQWQSKTTGKHIRGEILKFYQRYGNSAFCGLTYLGLPKSDEIPLDPKYPHCTKQFYERGVLAYDPNHLIANPPGSGSVYLLHLYGGDGGLGTDPLVTDLQSQLASAQKTDTTQLQADLTKYKTMAHQVALIVQGE